MNGVIGHQRYAFVGRPDGAGPRARTIGRPRRRPEPPRPSRLTVLALLAFGLGMVVLTQWLHPAGPIEDPLVTQQRTSF